MLIQHFHISDELLEKVKKYSPGDDKDSIRRTIISMVESYLEDDGMAASVDKNTRRTEVLLEGIMNNLKKIRGYMVINGGMTPTETLASKVEKLQKEVAKLESIVKQD